MGNSLCAGFRKPEAASMLRGVRQSSRCRGKTKTHYVLRKQKGHSQCPSSSISSCKKIVMEKNGSSVRTTNAKAGTRRFLVIVAVQVNCRGVCKKECPG